MPARRIVRDVYEAARDIARRKMKTKAFLQSREMSTRLPIVTTGKEAMRLCE